MVATIEGSMHDNVHAMFEKQPPGEKHMRRTQLTLPHALHYTHSCASAT